MAKEAIANCLFCKIYNGSEPNRILYKDDDIIVFPDIRPAAQHHYLIVSKEHIRDSKHLTAEHISLVDKMKQSAENILEQNGADMSDTRFGFHWPPFHTVSHLHLHAISPASQMGFIPRLIFKENSYWFVSIDYILRRLAKSL